MAKRDAPNDYYAWYNDDDRIAIVELKTSTDASKGIRSGEYDTYTDDTVSDGLRITFHSKYEEVDSLTDDLESGSGLDSTIHALVVDYVKSRILEDTNQFQEAQFFRAKFDQGVAKKPTRRASVRILSTPTL
jgi:hypothetical protein